MCKMLLLCSVCRICCFVLLECARRCFLSTLAECFSMTMYLHEGYSDNIRISLGRDCGLP